MSSKCFLIALIAGLLLSIGDFALGLPEEHAKYRFLSLPVTFAGSFLSVLGFLYLLVALPFWLALPVGLLLLAVAFVCVFFLVQKIVPKKISGPR